MPLDLLTLALDITVVLRLNCDLRIDLLRQFRTLRRIAVASADRPDAYEHGIVNRRSFQQFERPLLAPHRPAELSDLIVIQVVRPHQPPAEPFGLAFDRSALAIERTPAQVVDETQPSAGLRQADPLWRLPLHRPYRRLLDSPVADMNNVSKGGYGGAITAALFLESFVDGDVPWAHIDLMAWNLTSKPGRPEGGEAMGLRAAFAMLADYADKSSAKGGGKARRKGSER